MKGSYPKIGVNVEKIASSNFEEARAEFSWIDRETWEEAVKASSQMKAFRETGAILFWVADHSLGGRAILGGKPVIEIRDVASGDRPGVWRGYEPERVIFVEHTSASSGSGLRYIQSNVSLEIGRLEYFHGEDPFYRGSYSQAFLSCPEFGLESKLALEFPNEPLQRWEIEMCENLVVDHPDR